MFRLKSDLTKVNRFDVQAAAAVMSAGTQGIWLAENGDTLEFPTAGDAHVVQVWTEGNRDGSAGFTPDTSASGQSQLTVLQGRYRATTDQYVGTPAVGDKLGVNADGKLAVIGDGTGDTIAATSHAVAVVTKAPHAERHLHADTTVIRIATL